MLPVGSKFGPLLQQAVAGMRAATSATELILVAATFSAERAEEERLPVVIKMPTVRPKRDEGWKSYRARVEKRLLPLRDKIAKRGIEASPLVAANALQADADPQQLEEIATLETIDKLELDPLVQVATMDN